MLMLLTGEHRELAIYKLEEAADLYRQVLSKRVDFDTAGLYMHACMTLTFKSQCYVLSTAFDLTVAVALSEGST
jgi:hypothetical protein